MSLSRRSLVVYLLLLAFWAVLAGWQVQEHRRVSEAARADLRNRSKDIAKTVSAFIRGLRIRGRGPVPHEQLETVLSELVNSRTNELFKSSELISIELVNASGQQVAGAGPAIDLAQAELVKEGERWGRRTATIINPVDLGATLISEGATNPVFVLPPRSAMTNINPEGFRRDFPRRDQAPPPPRDEAATALSGQPAPVPAADNDGRQREGNSRRRPFWFRNMSDADYQSMVEKRELHGLALVMSTEPLLAATTHDSWLRCIIVSLAGISVLGLGLAWRNIATTADLQIRLIRASELNTHLKEMNLAAAGLAHETRNPLNIIRGLAQMISRQADAPAEIQKKSSEILDQTDKVTAQLNEFINYSRPREVRRSPVALGPVVTEVARALDFDLEEKKIRLQVKGDQLNIQADEQMLRQALFNLLINAIQAVNGSGEIQVLAEKRGAAEAVLEVRDNGPGVPPERRSEIFKPYFTTQKTGTGLGLAVVQQIILAHGWEIQCLPNEPQGAVFRISHLKLA